MESPDETPRVISAGKVQGTPVFNTDGERLGELYDVMIDKASGRIAYALMSFGGFLGIGERYHPLPWSSLKYDTRQEGYVVGIPRSVLQSAPSVAAGEEPAWQDAGYAEALHRHYDTNPFWKTA